MIFSSPSCRCRGRELGRHVALRGVAEWDNTAIEQNISILLIFCIHWEVYGVLRDCQQALRGADELLVMASLSDVR